MWRSASAMCIQPKWGTLEVAALLLICIDHLSHTFVLATNWWMRRWHGGELLTKANRMPKTFGLRSLCMSKLVHALWTASWTRKIMKESNQTRKKENKPQPGLCMYFKEGKATWGAHVLMIPLLVIILICRREDLRLWMNQTIVNDSLETIYPRESLVPFLVFFFSESLFQAKMIIFFLSLHNFNHFYFLL